MTPNDPAAMRALAGEGGNGGGQGGEGKMKTITYAENLKEIIKRSGNSFAKTHPAHLALLATQTVSGPVSDIKTIDVDKLSEDSNAEFAMASHAEFIKEQEFRENFIMKLILEKK